MPKYKKGEHDLRKPACFEYCKRAGNYCPLMDKANGVSVKRWTANYGDSNYSLNYGADRKGKDDSGTEAVEKVCSPCSCWGDGSGFEYDVPAMYLIGPGERNTSIYDIYNYAISHKVLQQFGNSWNAWIEKFQPDYRFGRVSDTNAETVLFPNINNPWMFTEYIFKGETKYNEAEFLIIEPPLYDPESLELINGDKSLEKKSDYDEKYLNEDITEDYKVKQFRKITNWDEWKTDSERWLDTKKTQPIPQAEGDYTVKNAGVKLYKADVNVQCVKWGEHGNIPPHTLDMTAPADYFDPTKIVSKIKAVTTAVIGSPLYAKTYGILIVNSGYDMYIQESESFSSEKEEGHLVRYSYNIPDSDSKDGVKQDTPKEKNGKKSLKPEYVKEHGSYIHGGCGLCHGEGGKVTCAKLQELEKTSAEYEYVEGKFGNLKSCMAFNNTGYCKYYVASSEYPVIATYKRNATNMSEYFNAMGTYTASASSGKQAWADNLLNNSTGLPSADMFVAMGVGMQHRTLVRGDTNLPEETTVTFITEFKVETAAKEMPKLNKEFKDFGKGIQIIPNTGKFALDTRENHALFGQDDLNCYDDISPLSFHRFFASVMHCATQANCNEYCGINQRGGFNPSKRAGGDGDCFYYHNSNDKKARGLHGCPYTCVPKRAVEFSETMQIAAPLFFSLENTISELSAYGFWDTNNPESVDYRNLWNKTGGGTIYGELFFTQGSLSGGKVKVTIYAKEDISTRYGGIKLKKEKSPPNSSYPYILGYMRGTKKDKKTEMTESFFYYQPLDDKGGVIKKSKNQHVDDEGLWLCKADHNFSPPITNCVMIDNEEKFIGGYHPQYKDFGAHGGEFMQELDAGYAREGNAMGDITNNSEYSGIEDPPLKKGYWIDASGQYIMDERPTGIDKPIASDAERETPSGPGTCISFKKSNTEIDLVSNKRVSPKVTNAAVFSNDSYNVIKTYKDSRKVEGNEITGRPMFEDPESDKKYYAPLNCTNPQYLPTMRKALWCKKCDYYISWRYKGQIKGDKCPWCGETYTDISGSKGGPSDSGGTWDKNASVIKKFFKLYAIGKVQVWGPPGTCVHTDAYFWRHLTPVSNAIKRQIFHRLGKPNTTGGSYSFSSMSKESELTLGLPEGLGYYKKIPADWNLSTGSSKPYHSSKIPWDASKYPTQTGGYNGIMPKDYMPCWNDNSVESVISPYVNSNSGKSIQMNSYSQMRVLRNAIEPVIAYSSDPPHQSDFPTKRASYDNREEANQNIIYQNKRARISPIVLAYTGGGDAYQEYYSGDMSYGNVREYYPPGYTWWFLKQTLGGRYSSLSQGPYHMDGGGGIGFNCVWPMTTQTIAKCALFIHGMLPLDKEILAAYLIITPGGPDPSKDPVGKSWSGGPTMYNHYHAKRKEHFNYGWQKHLHGTAGYPNGIYFDDDGNEVDTRPPGTIYFSSNDIEFQDYSDYRLWGSNNPKESNHVSTIENKFFDIMTNLSAMMDLSFYSNVGTEKDDIEVNGAVAGKGYKYVVQVADKDGNVHDEANPNLKGLAFMNCAISDDIHDGVTNRKYNYCLMDENGDIIQPYPDDLIWKTATEAQLTTAIQKGTTHFTVSASDGTKENTVSYTFTQTSKDLYGKTIPNNSQGITGYFDMSWTNTEGSIYGQEYTVQSGNSTVWTYPVIYQAPGGGNNAGYGGSIEIKNLGDGPRCVPLDFVKSMYEDRIARSFNCFAGSSLDDVKSMPFPYPQTEGTSIDQDCLLAQMVIKDEEDENTYLLTDVDSFPEIDADGSIPDIDSSGDKYPLAEKKVVLRCFVLFPITIYAENSYYVKTTTDSKTNKTKKSDVKYGAKTISNMESLKSVVEKVLPGVSFVKKSSNDFEIESGGTLEVPTGAKYIYGSLHIPTGTHSPKQSRVVSCSNYSPGGHPDGLLDFSGGQWVSNSYLKQNQNFVVDLARAPLLMKQRNYRYKPSSTNYSNCKCPNVFCSAHDKPCSIAANLLGKHWNSSSPYCPEGHSLEGVTGVISQPGDNIMTYEYAPPFSKNPFITKIVISTMEVGDKYCKFSVAVKYSEQDEWMTIHSESEENIAETTLTFDAEDPDSRLRARYVRVSVSPVETQESLSFDVVGIDGYTIEASGDFSSFDGFSFVGQKLGSGSSQVEVVSFQINEEKNRAIFYTNKNLTKNGIHFSKLNFNLKKYVCGVTSFAVYGFHYIDTQTSLTYHETMDNGSGDFTLKYLTITDPEDIWFSHLDPKQTKYTMGYYPTKIYSVEVCRPGENGYILEESEDTANLLWETTEDSIQTGKDEACNYTKITGGNYYFDSMKNQIVLPRKNSEGKKMTSFEEELRKKGLNVSFMPTRLVVRYFSGNGKTITLNAEAKGQGPSYQLEKDSIIQIDSSTMEDCGTSGKIKNYEATPIKWTCSNNLPSTLGMEQASTTMTTGKVNATTYSGEFRKPTFMGNEIADKSDDESFRALFGENQSNCRGLCKTEVTFTGAPNRIIWGTITVTAPAQKDNKPNGGLKNGCIIVSCPPSDDGEGLCTETVGIPKLLIYAKERE